MAPVVLSMNVHCDGCAEKIWKAAMKVSGVESVTASTETGLVVVEGTADAAVLAARLQSKTGKSVEIKSDGTEEEEKKEDEEGEEDGEEEGKGNNSAGGSVNASPAAPAPIVLEMDLHCGSCADKVERRAMEIPGVDTVTTDVQSGRVEVTGTADASAVATSLEVRLRKSVRVVSDPRRADVPAGYDHEWRKAAAARAAAEQMQEMYGGAGAAEQMQEEAAGTDASSSLSSLSPPPPPGRRRGRARQPAPSPPEHRLPPSPPPESSYGAPPPQAGYDYYPGSGGVYGGQYWEQPAMHQRGEFFGQQYPAYPPPEPGSYYQYGGGQQDEEPSSCSIQ